MTNRLELVLRKLCEETILNKLGFSKKFLRNVQHVRRIVLGIGLIKLKTIFKILALKLCTGYQRANIRIVRLIQINEDLVFAESKLILV